MDTGDYNLGLERLLPASPDTIPVAIGDIVQDSIEAAGATDLITFAGATDQVVLLALVETGGFTGSPAPQATLFAPSGAQVAIPIEANTQQQFTLPETGTYVVRVRDNGLAAAGTYTLGVESLQPASSDSLLAAGDLLAVSIASTPAARPTSTPSRPTRTISSCWRSSRRPGSPAPRRPR